MKAYPLVVFFVILLLATVTPALAQSSKESKQASTGKPKGYDKASYADGEAGNFMKNFLLAGPICGTGKPSENTDIAMQEKAFQQDILTQVNVVSGRPIVGLKVNEREYNWKLYTSAVNLINLEKIYRQNEDVYAYALAEIFSPVDSNAILSVGSDDAIKIWQNGKLIHQNWTTRGVVIDEDLISIKLVKGSNQILIKVHSIADDWGFAIRLVDKKFFPDLLASAIRKGNMDKVKLLIDNGADIHSKNQSGLTSLNIAKISGRNEIASYLQKLGAKEVTLPTEETIIDGFYASLKERENSAIALLVAIEGKAIYKKAFGYEDIKRKKQATLNTKFKIASITKQVIGAAILKLQENHLLRVTDKLCKYIPDFPRGDEVTLHHLLTHTSGIHNYFSEPALESKFITSITEEELINSFKNKPFDFNPGEKFKYNNSGYFLLGYIIGKVSGKPYGTYLKETFFDPLQMHNTGIHYAGIKLENEAKGYFNNNGTSVEASSWDMSWVGAAGAMYSTLDDLNKWNQAVFSGTVLKAESLKAALSPVVLNNGKNPDLGGLGYGYGWASSTYRGVERIWHMGLVDGFSSRIAYFPKTKMTVVMLANSLPDVVFDENIIAEVFLWKTMEKQD